MRLSTLAIIVCLLSGFPPLPVAAGSNRPVQSAFSADDFDWRNLVPYLYQAAEQPGEQGIRTMLENSKIMRTHVLNEVRAECKPGNSRCDSSRDGFTLDGEATRRIDGIIRESLVHSHHPVSVDYALEGQPFPFSDIAVLKSDDRQDAYLILKFSDHAYTVNDVQNKYGAPYDTDIFDRYSVFKYRLQNELYKSNAVFEVDPRDGAVLKVAQTLKPKKRH